ncbi:AAA family ATPase [Ensifer aridi]|uniref:AAA family ATPase n=1 Tax=Ensifer aridi TaxID=1708715 RepID=UPI000428B624|nr:AAA family ATPase [Ensifer aridi]
MARIDFERLVARLHIDRILDSLGFHPTGIHVIVVPPTSISNVWQDAAALAVQEIRKFRNGEASEGSEIMDFPFQPMEPGEVGYDVDTALMRHNMGIESGIDDAACTLIIADGSDAEHPSVPLADSVFRPELDIDLVILAAAQCGREITADDAILLAEMPWRRRRIAISAARPIAETHRLHLQAAAAEEERKAKELAEKSADKADKKGQKMSERIVPDVLPVSEMHGYGDAQTWALELAKDIEDWRAGKITWADVDNGVLLSGAPGCGKTTFAAALARTLDAHLVIGSYAAWIGTGEGHQGDLIRAMRAAFDEAREHAPAVVLVDEIDNFVSRGSIGHARSDEWMRGVVNSLLECLDGAIAREGVIVVGATNDASGIDAALRRPGRLDRHVEIPLPDAEARVAILKQHLGVELPTLSVLPSRTVGMSGADLERCARDARRIARREGTEVNLKHVLRTLPRLERRSRDDIRQIATHEVGHAVVAAALGSQVEGVAISKEFNPELKSQGPQVEGFATIRSATGRRDFQWFADRIAYILGGMEAEKLVFGSHGDGVSLDLAQATEMATYALSSLGMGDTLASDGHRDAAALAQARSFDPLLRRRVEDVLRDQAERARGILEQHHGAFNELVEVLILRGRLGGDDVHETINAYTQSPQLSLAV